MSIGLKKTPPNKKTPQKSNKITVLYLSIIICLGWVLSTLLGCLKPNPLYTHILNIYIIGFGWV